MSIELKSEGVNSVTQGLRPLESARGKGSQNRFESLLLRTEVL